jgi:dihydroorotase-like cyclic amidohydrolase
LGVALTSLPEMPRSRLIATMTCNPARVLGLAGRKGALTPGFDGDVTLIDPGHTWTVTPQTLHSQRKNSPLLGEQLTGRARAVVTRGKVFAPGSAVAAH